MAVYLYFSLTPESLVASMLSPRDFGAYLAVGTAKRTHGQAIFFTIEGLKEPSFPLKDIQERCVAHPNGEPKHSVYLSVYRVLERIPLETIRNLYLVTQDGRVLEIEQSSDLPQFAQGYHLYQELCPVHPRVVSTLDPVSLTRHITDEKENIYIPKVCFVDLRLGELAEDPVKGQVRDLPYYAIEHLRDCLIQLRDNPDKNTKTVDRIHAQWFPYRTVEKGVFVGDSKKVLYFPFPSEEDLQTKYYEWWHSALNMGDAFGAAY